MINNIVLNNGVIQVTKTFMDDSVCIVVVI